MSPAELISKLPKASVPYQPAIRPEVGQKLLRPGQIRGRYGIQSQFGSSRYGGGIFGFLAFRGNPRIPRIGTSLS